MALATQLAPYTAGTIDPLLVSTAKAAASFCNQGTDNTQCTMWWTNPNGPATLGVGQQMSALNVFNANMVKFVGNSITTSTSGGTSAGNPNAGSSTSDQLVMYVPLFVSAVVNE